MPNTIKPPDSGRIAAQVSSSVKTQYDTIGLTTFREEYEAGASGQILVSEGYIEETILPNGKVITKKIVTRSLTVQEAEEES
jgi:hypothetical protein